MSLLTRSLTDTPIAVIDLETTGLSPQGDRIVELAVVRIDPGQEPRVVLDTLVNPQRRVSGSEIHGIYDVDVEGAPTFRELVAPFTEAVDGAVIASFNVYFDIKFLINELELAKHPMELPHLCLMWLRPGLGLGQRASLERTCAELGVPFAASHQAAADASASAALWPLYARAATERGVRTFGDLAAVKDYKFTKSWSLAPLDPRGVSALPPRTALKPRPQRSAYERTEVRRREWGAQDALAAYWNALTAALVDSAITPAERNELLRLQASPLLRPESIRYVHAKVLAGLLEEVSRDLAVDDAEVEWLASVTALLQELGWAPGVTTQSAARTADAKVLTQSKFELLPKQGSWWQRMFCA
jgi:DNA polymerase III epsilon subunit-like protein